MKTELTTNDLQNFKDLLNIGLQRLDEIDEKLDEVIEKLQNLSLDVDLPREL